MVAIGLNGVDFPSEHSMQHREISRALEFSERQLALANDGIAALWGATGAPAAAIIQLGSGFTGAWRRRHGGETLFDHLGMGGPFDIRRELARLVARMIDGRAETTPLKDAVLEHFGIGSNTEYAEAIYTGRVKNIMTTPPLVFKAWANMDPAATNLVHKLADDIAVTAACMARRIGIPKAPIFLGGGVVACAPDTFWSLLQNRLTTQSPGAVIKRPMFSPDIGAGMMAAFHAGLDPEAFFAAVENHSGQRRVETASMERAAPARSQACVEAHAASLPSRGAVEVSAAFMNAL